MVEHDQNTPRTRRELWIASGFGLLAVGLVVAGFVASPQFSWWLIAAGFLLCVNVTPPTCNCRTLLSTACSACSA